MRQDRLATNPWLIFLVTALGIGMASIDSGIVNVALPTFAQHYKITVSEVQWVVTSYLLMICVMLPLSGYLSDLFTRRRIYLLGFLIFTIGSLLCGLSYSFLSLVLFRFLQGIGAAMILANNQAIIMTTFPKEKRGRALSVSSMLVAIGSIVGPSLGGFLISLGDWRWIFLINIPVGIVGIWMGLLILPVMQTVKKSKFDFLGAFLFTFILSAFIFLVTHVSDLSMIPGEKSLLLILFIISAFWFYLYEKRVPTPMIHFSLLKIWTFSTGIFVGFVLFLALSANIILLPFYLQLQQGLSPASIGLVLLIAPMMIIIVAPISGTLITRVNALFLILFGLFMFGVGIGLQSLLNPNSSLIHVVIDQVLIGIGSGLFSSPNAYTLLQYVPVEKIGISNGLSSLMRNLGKVVGTAIATGLFSYFRLSIPGTKGFMLGFRVALLVATLFILLGFILTLVRFPLLRAAMKHIDER